MLQVLCQYGVKWISTLSLPWLIQDVDDCASGRDINEVKSSLGLPGALD